VRAAPHWSDALRAVGACQESIVWALTQPDAATAWAACERADWMLWIAARLATADEARRSVTLAACACARTVLHCIPAGEDRPRVCIETTESWARGNATLEQVRAVRCGAHDARSEMWRKHNYAAADAADAAAAYDAAADTATSAAAAAAAAYDAAADTATSAAAAAAYAYATDTADADAARSDSLRMQASIVRGILPMPVMGLA